MDPIMGKLCMPRIRSGMLQMPWIKVGIDSEPNSRGDCITCRPMYRPSTDQSLFPRCLLSQQPDVKHRSANPFVDLSIKANHTLKRQYLAVIRWSPSACPFSRDQPQIFQITCHLDRGNGCPISLPELATYTISLRGSWQQSHYSTIIAQSP